jgi:hypothetical protein
LSLRALHALDYKHQQCLVKLVKACEYNSDFVKRENAWTNIFLFSSFSMLDGTVKILSAPNFVARVRHDSKNSSVGNPTSVIYKKILPLESQ